MKTSKGHTVRLLLSMLAGGWLASSAPAATSFDYVGRPGFTDPKHTRSDGYQFSELVAASRNSFFVGESQRFFGTPHPEFGALPDRSAWMGVGLGGSKSIGLYDAAHKSATGYHTSDVIKFGPGWGGPVIGHSVRYDGTPIQRGQSAWVADWWGGTRRIGLFYDGPPPLPDGSRWNHVIDLIEVGISIVYAPTHRGQTAWRASRDGATARVGFYDGAHVSPGADPNNTPIALNYNGDVIGHVNFSGGQVAWLHPMNSSMAIEIGLDDIAHQLEPGNGVINRVTAINSSGHAIGSAARRELPFEGADFYFYDAWASKPSGETILLDQDTEAGSTPQFITESNLVGGNDYAPAPQISAQPWIYDINTGVFRYLIPPNTPGLTIMTALTEDGVAVGTRRGFRRESCWLAPKGAQAVDIGFYATPEYLSDGVPNSQKSEIVATSQKGTTTGISHLYAAGGITGWIASPTTGRTYKIGLYDAVHSGAVTEGFARQTSVPTHINGSSLVAGYSLRYHGDNSPEGQTAWVYNSPKARYAILALSVRASDGYAYSKINQILENGVAVGTYTKFAEDGTDLGERAFVWITGRGAFDIEDRLDVDPATVNWEYLANAVFATEGNDIVGYGVPLGSATSQGVFHVKLDWW
jgi:hypothetical protein